MKKKKKQTKKPHNQTLPSQHHGQGGLFICLYEVTSVPSPCRAALVTAGCGLNGRRGLRGTTPQRPRLRRGTGQRWGRAPLPPPQLLGEQGEEEAPQGAPAPSAAFQRGRLRGGAAGGPGPHLAAWPCGAGAAPGAESSAGSRRRQEPAPAAEDAAGAEEQEEAQVQGDLQAGGERSGGPGPRGPSAGSGRVAAAVPHAAGARQPHGPRGGVRQRPGALQQDRRGVRHRPRRGTARPHRRCGSRSGLGRRGTEVGAVLG